MVELRKVLPGHSKEVTNFMGVDIGFVDVGMDEVGKPNKAIEEVTEAQMEEKDNRIELEH